MIENRAHLCRGTPPLDGFSWSDVKPLESKMKSSLLSRFRQRSKEQSPFKGEASHIQDLNPEEQNRYRNFTDVLDIGSKSTIVVSAFVGVVNQIDSNKEFFNSNLINLAGLVGVSILGYLYAKFRKKATSMVMEA